MVRSVGTTQCSASAPRMMPAPMVSTLSCDMPKISSLRFSSGEVADCAWLTLGRARQQTINRVTMIFDMISAPPLINRRAIGKLVEKDVAERPADDNADNHRGAGGRHRAGNPRCDCWRRGADRRSRRRRRRARSVDGAGKPAQYAASHDRPHLGTGRDRRHQAEGDDNGKKQLMHGIPPKIRASDLRRRPAAYTVSNPFANGALRRLLYMSNRTRLRARIISSCPFRG